MKYIYYSKKLILTGLTVIHILALFAQSSPDEISNSFFTIYKNKNSDSALDFIFKTNKYYLENKEDIEALKQKLRKAYILEGEFKSYELLSKLSAGRSLILMTFLVNHERDPLTFRILFYKPYETWQLQNFKFDNKMDEELEIESKGSIRE